MRPDVARVALADVIPAIIDRYADMGSTAAATWYQDVWNAWFDTDADSKATFDATVAMAKRTVDMRALVWNAADAWLQSDPDRFFDYMAGIADRNVKAGGRATIVENVRRDPMRPRFARVPSGRPCPFCLMLASRGAVYASAETAGGEGHDYHDHCGCEPVPMWGDDARVKLDGYRPEHFKFVYRRARDLLEHPEMMDKDLREKVMASAPYTANRGSLDAGLSATTYEPGDPNNMNSMAAVMKALFPNDFD